MKSRAFILNLYCIVVVLNTTGKKDLAVSANQFVPDAEKKVQNQFALRRVQGLREKKLFNHASNVTASNIDPQIIGGLHAPIGFFTHQVALFRPLEDGSFRFRCGGSLIAKNVILGAAQCVYNSSTGLYFGDEYIAQWHANLNQYYLFQEHSNMEVQKICDVIVHPKFIYGDVREYFDFALYKLCEDSDLAANGTIIPIKVNKEETIPSDNEVLTATGWGSVDPIDYIPSDELMMVNVNYINNTKCTTPPFLYSIDNITDDMMCAGALVGGGRDTCGGDGGGPLIIQGNQYNNHLLVGITSWAFDNSCALPNYPGVYSRVSYVIDWILENGCSFVAGECDIQTN